MMCSRRESYPNELFINDKKLILSSDKKLVVSSDKNIPRENEFLRDFCEWRKAHGLFVPKAWEK
jgi:hypothetical protein